MTACAFIWLVVSTPPKKMEVSWDDHQKTTRRPNIPRSSGRRSQDQGPSSPGATVPFQPQVPKQRSLGGSRRCWPADTSTGGHFFKWEMPKSPFSMASHDHHDRLGWCGATPQIQETAIWRPWLVFSLLLSSWPVALNQCTRPMSQFEANLVCQERWECLPDNRIA